MIVKFSYYNLKENKKFSDGSVVDTTTILRKLSNDKENYCLVETVDTYDFKKIFPVKLNDIVLVETKKEKWTSKMLKQQKKEIEEDWIKTTKK